MWPLCSANNILWLLLPLLIGLLTGWWAWRATGHAAAVPGGIPEPVRPRPVSPPVSPRPAAVEPVRLAPTAEPARVPDIQPASAPLTGPVAAAAAIGIAPPVGEPDDLKHIVGIGPKLNDLLNSLGITRFDQIARWGSAEIAKVDSHLGAFSGRIARDSWVEQARLLASGAVQEWTRRFGGGATNT